MKSLCNKAPVSYPIYRINPEVKVDSREKIIKTGIYVCDGFDNNFSVHDKFHRTLILSGFCFLKIAKISLNSSFFPKPIKR